MEPNKNSSRRRQEGKKSAPLNRKPFKKEYRKIKPTQVSDESLGIRLNKYIANSGVCSRREGDTYIDQGSVQVNGKLVTEMGYKVLPTDIVQFDGTGITPEQKNIFYLINLKITSLLWRMIEVEKQ